MGIIKTGKRHDEREQAKWKHEGAVMARANVELHDKATALALRLDVPYKKATEIVRAEDKELRDALQGKGKGPSYEDSKAVRYSHCEESPAEIRAQVDKEIKEALGQGLISHYKYGGNWLKDANPELHHKYSTL